MEVVLNAFEDFIGVNFFTMLLAWVNLVILYVFLKKLLFKPVKNMIDSRKEEIDGMYSDAEEAKTDAEAMRTEYESKLSAASEECDEMLRSAVRRAQLKEEEILREANVKADRTMARAEEQIALEKKNALNEVKNEISDMAVSIAAAVIERDINAADHAGLIDDFINKLGEE